MGIRDLEFQRLLLYAKGLGLKVTVYNRYNKHAVAQWIMDGSAIDIFVPKGMSKTELNLTLLHELGHMLNFIHDKNRKHPQKLEKAWERENNTKAINLPKSTRKLIYEDEVAGAQWWDAIAKEVNLKIPDWRIQQQKEYDLWVYEYFYKNGVYPKKKLGRIKFQELRNKWKN